MPEIVQDGVTGYTFNKGDIKEYAGKVIAALNDPGHYEALSANAKNLILRDHTPAVVVPDYETVYHEAVR